MASKVGKILKGIKQKGEDAIAGGDGGSWGRLSHRPRWEALRCV